MDLQKKFINLRKNLKKRYKKLAGTFIKLKVLLQRPQKSQIRGRIFLQREKDLEFRNNWTNNWKRYFLLHPNLVKLKVPMQTTRICTMFFNLLRTLFNVHPQQMKWISTNPMLTTTK